ncbi:hypothetical protein ACSCBZ_04780 [Streptomyces niveiscabiei]|uniref:hypothetical protein n=1 Tax=Streptomyces TaxID=1883 RepID=UPI00105805A9|nr:hypothetical protein [Streptomyces sp. V2]
MPAEYVRLAGRLGERVSVHVSASQQDRALMVLAAPSRTEVKGHRLRPVQNRFTAQVRTSTSMT